MNNSKLESMNSILLFEDIENNPIRDDIWIGGSPYDLEAANADVRLRWRAVEGSILLLDEPAIVVAGEQSVVTYQVTSAQAIQGIYRAWWHITLPSGQDIDVPEFEVVIDRHAPGRGVLLGAIASGLSNVMPETVRGLSGQQWFGDRRLQKIVEQEKRKLLASPPAVADEVTLPLVVQEYLAKASAMALYPAAQEYWAVQRSGASTRDEAAQYPDRLAMLKEQHAWLRGELTRLRPYVDAALGAVDAVLPTRRSTGPRTSAIPGARNVTADPQLYPRNYSTGWETEALRWAL